MSHRRAADVQSMAMQNRVHMLRWKTKADRYSRDLALWLSRSSKLRLVSVHVAVMHYNARNAALRMSVRIDADAM